MKDRLVLVIVICTLSAVMVSVIGVLLSGLFQPTVDNTEIFKILGPAFQTIVGAFVGVLGGRAMRDENKGNER
jgi:uncharacterized membrane protein YraQ (UPF0718 family)